MCLFPYTQVTGVFARRGYSIQSLAVGPSEREGMSRICMVVPGTDESIAKLFKQLSKLVYVFALADLTNTPFVNRELLLVKVGGGGGWNVCVEACSQPMHAVNHSDAWFLAPSRCALQVSCDAQQRGELRHLAQIFRADILDVSGSSIVMEIAGKEDKLRALTDLLEPYGEREGGTAFLTSLPPSPPPFSPPPWPVSPPLPPLPSPTSRKHPGDYAYWLHHSFCPPHSRCPLSISQASRRLRAPAALLCCASPAWTTASWRGLSSAACTDDVQHVY